MDYPLFSDLFHLKDCCVSKDCLSSVAKLPDLHCDLDSLCVPLVFDDLDIICVDCRLPDKCVKALELVQKVSFANIVRVEEDGAVLISKIDFSDGKLYFDTICT